MSSRIQKWISKLKQYQLRQILLEKIVVRVDEIVGGSVEDEPALVQHEEAGAGVSLFFREFRYLAGVFTEAVTSEQECVLQAMSHEDGAGSGDVPLLDDQIDDRRGCDGVEAAGRRIVQNQFRLSDDGAGDGNTAPHAS